MIFTTRLAAGYGARRCCAKSQTELGAPNPPSSAYLRYVDDMALFSDSKRELWAWKRAIVERLASLRLIIHETASQVMPVSCGIPWLGFVIYPTVRRVKARKVRNTTRHLGERFNAYRSGKISFSEFDASIKGWVNHVRYTDSLGLRRHVFSHLANRLRPHGNQS